MSQNDPQTNGQGAPGGNKPPSSKKELPTIDEHAVNLKVDAPIFAAVMQSKKWASGKRMPEADFQTAVKEFLNSPMGGK
jgi:hypothetical protein